MDGSRVGEVMWGEQSGGKNQRNVTQKKGRYKRRQVNILIQGNKKGPVLTTGRHGYQKAKELLKNRGGTKEKVIH